MSLPPTIEAKEQFKPQPVCIPLTFIPFTSYHAPDPLYFPESHILLKVLEYSLFQPVRTRASWSGDIGKSRRIPAREASPPSLFVLESLGRWPDSVPLGLGGFSSPLVLMLAWPAAPPPVTQTVSIQRH